MIQLRIWRGQTTLAMRTRRSTRPATPQHDVFEDRYPPSIKCGAGLFSTMLSRPHLFHIFLNLWLSAANHKRVLHCSSAIDCGGPNRDGWVQGGLVVGQQVRLPSSCFDSESPGDAPFSAAAGRAAGPQGKGTSMTLLAPTTFPKIVPIEIHAADLIGTNLTPCVYRKPYRGLLSEEVDAMIALICFVLAVLASPFKSKSRLEAENAVLRHQLIVLRRKVRGRLSPPTTTAGSPSRCIDGFNRS